ncbi:HEAT repeat-containing protein 6-like isoform X1 [Littorina saxatilis]
MVFVFKEDEATRASINLLLDELIALDCNSLVINNEQGNSLLKRLCNLIPSKHERLVTKVCQVIHNFIKYRLVSPLYGDTSRQLADFLIQVMRVCADWALADVLKAAAVLMEDNWEPFLQYQDVLVGESGILASIVNTPTPDVGNLGDAAHCLRCLAMRTTDKEGLSRANAATCFTTLVNLLHTVPSLELYHSLQCRVVVDALLGVNSLVSAKVDVESHLGQLLAAVKGYMFHGLGQPINIPQQLFPTIALGYQSKSPHNSSPASAKPAKNDQSTPTTTKSKNKKTRKKKSGASEETVSFDSMSLGDGADEKDGKGVMGNLATGIDSLSLQPAWVRFTSSDSEISDADTSQGAKSHAHSTKVRIAALSCLAAISKLVDKRAMFGYWAFFIPDSAGAGNSPQVQTLFTSILKDPSPKCRMGALVSLTAMLDGTKQFLAAAEESSKVQTAFTPLSTLLGAMIRELHRALLQALVVENYNLTLTQLIKCLATLVVNVPYHRLQPGLLSRVVKQIRHFLSHKDSNVRVACLTCLGALASHQPPLMEVFHIVQSPTPPVGMTTAATLNRGVAAMTPASLSDSGIDTQSTSSPGSCNPITDPSLESSGQGTPTLGTSPGIHTPVFTDQMLQAQVHETSWVIKLCIRNILPQPAPSSLGGGEGSGAAVEPLPVRLESLQVLAMLARGYFPIVRSQLGLIQDLIQRCLEDSDPTIKLHGCKVLEELGTVMIKDVQDNETAASPSPQALTIHQALSVWQSVLDGPLLTILQQSDTTNPVRASACDCVANVGAEIFTLLTKEQQQLCLKLVLKLTQSSDRLVMSAAVRALGVMVLYPCLSQDVNFVADVANVILKCISVPSINVKIKAAWSLGNLCDALVVNKDKGDKQFMDQFSDMLLSSMLMAAAKATQDSDKVKCNAVRAVGNMLRYLPARSLGKSHIVDAVASSVKIIIKTMNSGPMKVRWNSCYAIANMLRNPLLLTGDTPWLVAVLTALSQVVKDCNNFKVRINSALALAVPAERQHYGDVVLYVTVWHSLLQSLKTAENITDFAEFRYRDSLTEQVCMALLHMLSLSETGDIVALLPHLRSMGFLLQDHMYRFLADKAPTKVSAVKKVEQRAVMLGSEDETQELTAGLKLLHEVCLLDTEEQETEMSPSHPTAFRQIYD